jgi:hypothetical protein
VPTESITRTPPQVPANYKYPKGKQEGRLPARAQAALDTLIFLRFGCF